MAKHDVETFAKVAAFVAFLAYVLGLVATALYLEKLDVPLPDLAAVEPRFIYTGGLVLGCFIVAGLVPLLMTIELTKPLWTGFKVAILLVAAFAQWWLYEQILQRDQPSATAATEWTAVYLTLSATGVVVISGLLIVKGRSDPKHRSAYIGFGVPAVVALVVWFLNLFGGWILPRVPEQYGGLQPKRARLLFTNDTVRDAKSIGVVFEHNTHLSTPVRVVYESDTNYVLQLDDHRVIQMARNQVIGSITDSKLPTPRTIEERDHRGRPDVAERGDQIVLTFSEPIDPASVLPGWDGSRVTVALRVKAASDDAGNNVTVRDRAGRRDVALGTIHFDQPPHLDKPQFTHARMALQGQDVLLTLDDPLPLRAPRGTLRWRPSSQATDAVGNGVLARQVGG